MREQTLTDGDLSCSSIIRNRSTLKLGQETRSTCSLANEEVFFLPCIIHQKYKSFIKESRFKGFI